ncbi:MAG TPA: hypothetical protein VFE62_15885 [Gemmataceae bacterium]|nr:hypothetical protein [Gemmataceae bacterium]
MKARMGGVVLMLLYLGAVAAGEGTTHEKIIVQMIGNLDDIAKTLKAVVDAETAEASKADLRKSATTWMEARAKGAKLQPPEKDEKLRLEKLYKPKLEESLRKMFTEVRRVENIPGGKDALKEIAGVLKKDEKK